jgi:hypothetical protein
MLIECEWTDSSIDAEWRMSLDKRGDGEGELEADGAVPELRADAGDTVGHGKTGV